MADFFEAPQAVSLAHNYSAMHYYCSSSGSSHSSSTCSDEDSSIVDLSTDDDAAYDGASDDSSDYNETDCTDDLYAVSGGKNEFNGMCDWYQ